jgi:hypothetical protein
MISAYFKVLFWYFPGDTVVHQRLQSKSADHTMELTTMDRYHILTFQGNDTGGYSDDDKEDDGSSVMFSLLEAGCKHPDD